MKDGGFEEVKDVKIIILVKLSSGKIIRKLAKQDMKTSYDKLMSVLKIF
jgi:hypothetical protein